MIKAKNSRFETLAKKVEIRLCREHSINRMVYDTFKFRADALVSMLILDKLGYAITKKRKRK